MFVQSSNVHKKKQPLHLEREKQRGVCLLMQRFLDFARNDTTFSETGEVEMIEKTDITYANIRDGLVRKYTSQKENLHNGNIESYNDYITDEVCGEGAFANDVDAFLHVLSICVALTEFGLKDEYFFSDIQKMILKYKSGYYDEYFADGENKTDIETDITAVEKYMVL